MAILDKIYISTFFSLNCNVKKKMRSRQNVYSCTYFDEIIETAYI